MNIKFETQQQEQWFFSVFIIYANHQSTRNGLKLIWILHQSKIHRIWRTYTSYISDSHDVALHDHYVTVWLEYIYLFVCHRFVCNLPPQECVRRRTTVWYQTNALKSLSRGFKSLFIMWFILEFWKWKSPL